MCFFEGLFGLLHRVVSRVLFESGHYVSDWWVNLSMQTLAAGVHSAQKNKLRPAMSF